MLRSRLGSLTLASSKLWHSSSATSFSSGPKQDAQQHVVVVERAVDLGWTRTIGKSRRHESSTPIPATRLATSVPPSASPGQPSIGILRFPRPTQFRIRSDWRSVFTLGPQSQSDHSYLPCLNASANTPFVSAETTCAGGKLLCFGKAEPDGQIPPRPPVLRQVRVSGRASGRRSSDTNARNQREP